MKDFVKLQDITKIYKMGEIEIRAADNISFSIDKGEFVVIVGPSGAGKTTVLISSAGWILPQAERFSWTERRSRPITREG